MTRSASHPAARVSTATASMALSAIKEMAMRSAATPGAASLAWGLPSFPTPHHIRAAVARGLEEDPDIGKYALPDGLPELRRQVAESHLAATGVAVDPERQVHITAGNMQGVATLLKVILDPGDEVIVTDPGFASHIQQVVMYGGRPVYWRLDEADGWSLDIETLSGLVTDRTRAVILVSPSNPTGKIFDREQLLAVAALARKRGFLVVIDDPYSHFVYENRARAFCLAAAPEYADAVVYLFTFSKAYAMSGWRLGYMILPMGMKAAVLKVHDATMICAPRISQVAGLAGLSGPRDHLAEFERILGSRRALICERLDAVPHVFDYVRPEGAYYVFPRILVPHETSRDFAFSLLDEAKVTVTPGGAFGPGGEHHVRMAYCVDEDTIDLAFDRIEKRFPG